jgi:hypothetical protein
VHASRCRTTQMRRCQSFRERHAAMSRKTSTFWSSRPCRNGHTGERYRDGRCVTCCRLRMKRRYRKWRKANPSVREAARKAREKAAAAGKLFYKGLPCRKKAHDGKRHVSTKLCFHCGWPERPSLHELPRREHERILKGARERSRRASRALAVLKELGLPL